MTNFIRAFFSRDPVLFGEESDFDRAFHATPVWFRWGIYAFLTGLFFVGVLV